jgi:formylglycine-generating enzyme required for sulfatase activity
LDLPGISDDFAQLIRRCASGELPQSDVLAGLDALLRAPAADRASLHETLAAAERDFAYTLPLGLIGALRERIDAGQDLTCIDMDRKCHAPGPAAIRSSTDAAAIRAAADRQVGAVLKGRFELLECIGHGGMSTVYKAVDRRKSEALLSEPHVAVKILRTDLAKHRDLFAVLQRETQRTQSLGHPNIVRVFDCDRDGETVFMTMEYLAGASLTRKLAAVRNDPTRKAALQIISAIGSALAFAHRSGVVHGDLKPSNVIITHSGYVKVIDFGIARLLPQRRGDTGATGEPPLSAATPAYASPEMLEGEDPDPRDDVFALACVAYILLTSRHPFDREPSNRARDAQRRPPAHANLTRRQHAALAAALAFARDKRTATVEELVAGLRPPAPAAGRHAVRYAAAAAALVTLGAVGLAALNLRSPSERAATPARAAATLTPQQDPASDVFRDCDTCPRMTTIPAGTFVQGATPAGDGTTAEAETPARSVVIDAPFAVGIYEVTLAEYAAFAGETGRESAQCAIYDGGWQVSASSGWRYSAYSQGPSHPVTCVSWVDASAYVAWLSNKTGSHYRLPSASEWEYVARGGAAKAGTEQSDAAGPQAACASGNVADLAARERYEGWTVHECTDGYVYTAPVGSFAPNAFGVYDTIGNAFEWVADCWHEDYRGAPTNGSAWLDGDCAQRELRGGSWFTEPGSANGAARNRFAADYRSNTFGFRVAKEIAP